MNSQKNMFRTCPFFHLFKASRFPKGHESLSSQAEGQRFESEKQQSMRELAEFRGETTKQMADEKNETAKTHLM